MNKPVMHKPAPLPTSDTAEYWQACNRDELLYQRCDSCGHVQFYPRRICTACQSNDLGWHRSAQKGTIHSFTVVHRAANRAFDADVPFVLALIDLDEGFRMMTNVIGEECRTATIGRRVRVVFEQHSSGQKLPQAILEPLA
jgi:uncharacterized OB-fold protein